MTTKISDDGRYYWDGTQWRSSISPDGRWRWDGERWVAQSKPVGRNFATAFGIGSWIGAAISALILLLCLFVFITAIPAWIQGNREAPGAIAGGLLVLSFAVLLATPLVVRFAIRRGYVVIASIGAAVLFVGSCGGGIALGTAFPSPSAAQPASAPAKSPRPETPLAANSPASSPESTSTPTAGPSPTPAVADTCGAPPNPWGYNFCNRGSRVTSPPADFCTYFAPCVSTFWSAKDGYVVQCGSGSWSHSGGIAGACSKNGGVAHVLYAGP